MESRHVKSINTDTRSTKRIKFASAKERSKGASADVYRSHKRKLGATSSATREEAVHNPHRELGSRKRQRAHHLVVDDDRSKAAVISVGIDDDVDVDAPELAKEDSVLNADSSLADELDETLDRNASEVFGKFYRKVWPMVRSLPEILHHAEKVIDVMLSHMLSPESTPEVPTDPIALRDPSKAPRGYVVNHATLDILHLLSVLARDLRHEIHSYLPSILQRIIHDLLNPPPPPLETGKQPIPLDVTLVETAFRCMSYIFRYDADKIVEDMEAMRKYYGATLAARRELVRRLASQTFAPLIRKLKNQNERHRHLKRVLKALVAATDGQPMTALLKRTQTDAVDGISQLIFQVARGVPGRLHSQGLSTLRFVMTYCAIPPVGNGDGNRSILLVTLASDLIDRLYRHLHENTKASLTEMLAATLKTSCSEAAFSQAGVSSTMNTLRLFSKAATMQFGARGARQTAEQISLFCETLDILFSKACIAKFSSEQRQEVMTLAAPIWLTIQDSHRAERSLQQCLRIIFGLDDMVNNTHENEAESVRTMTAVLARDLLPYLKNQGCLGIVGTAALSAAARLAKSDQYSALLTTFAIATKQPVGGESASTTYFRLFHDAGGALYKIPRNVQNVLLETCLVASNGSIWGKGRVEQLLVSLRCIPFVFNLNSEIAGSDERKDLFETTASSLVDVFVNVAKATLWRDGESNSDDILVVQGLCLESLSRLANDFLVGSGDEGTVKKILSLLIESADKLLFSSGSSLWVVRGLAAFANLLHKVDLQLNDKLDDTFDALVSNLSQPSHELRLHTLEILATYPAKNFVVDHADLDLSGDLDEEPSYRPVDIDRGTRRSPVGKCDLIEILLQIESSKVQLTQERPLLGMVSRVEVLGRTGKLPVIYAEAAAHHLLGLFNVKFAPLWPVVEKALAALAEGHENDIWPALEKKLVATMKAESMQDDEYDDVSKHDMCMSFEEHREACLLWEKSQGRVVTLFSEEPVVQDGEVYRHLTTDKATYMESVWGVAEKCQQLVAKHSRVIVPTFVEFLSSQYFLYHFDDPSARELDWNKPACNSTVDREMLRKFDLQKKLICFLRVFAIIDGPQQLVQHKLLEQIFRSFLTHQETQVVHLSLSALLKFKPKHVMPYCELLTGLLEKGKLRSALLTFQEALEAGKIAQEHRELFVPIVSRVLFGRLSSRESRSAKDSPAARRAAILSFVSLLCKEDQEIFSFVYLMVRSFIPRGVVHVKEVESYSGSERSAILNSLSHIDATKLPSAVLEGFLHLLQPVIAQLGHRIKSYIPMVASILLAICRFVAVGEKDEEGTQLVVRSDETSTSAARLRHGAIRTLCFQRLSEMFSMYAGAIDGEVVGMQLWGAIRLSVDLLPEMVMKAEKPPALLQLFETLSSEEHLVRILYMHKPAIEAIIKCIASTTLTPVMNTTLAIVERLLETVIANETNKSQRGVFAAYVPLLMEQFANRLRSTEDSDQLLPTQPYKRSRVKLREATWRKELHILCRVSELLDANDESAENGMIGMAEELSGLLLPFLEPGQGTSDNDKINVLGILKRIIGRVNKECLEMAFYTVSGVLGPNKGKCGIESITVRNEVAALLKIIANSMPLLQDVALKTSRLSAINSKRIDEVDFETIIAELNVLNKEDAGCDWQCLASEDPLKLFPIINICFHYLYSEDGVLARASFNALKTVVNVASKHSTVNSSWLKVIESLVVPPSRAGLQARSSAIRRFYVLIIREMALRFHEHQSPNLCGDLRAFVDEDNPDLDFFLGITHVQLHRRGRAFQRLRRILNENNLVSSALSSQSLSGVLLPLALHPAYESKMKVEESFALEGIATVGAIARLLPWNKYHNVIQSILSSFDRHPEQERYLVGTLCAIIDAFKFDLVAKKPLNSEDVIDGNDELQKTAVWRALERRIIPKLEGFLIKEKVDKSGSKTKLIRPPVVLALMKLFQKFPEEFFELKLPHILTVLCDALRSKDSDARDLARTTLAKIVIGMDRKYLSDVVRELVITLNEGYKLHVRSATLHTILQDLLGVHSPPDSQAGPSNFDASIPAMMDMLQEDLFGEANERRESQETNVRFVKEAGGNKSVHSIELICRMIQFKPSRASDGDITNSSIHCVVSPLLERLRASDVKASTIAKIKEILIRVVIGLSHNPSVNLQELFPFVYVTIQPYIGSQLISAVLDDEDAEGEEDYSLTISGSRTGKTKTAQSKKSGKVAEWRPSTLKNALSSKSAFDLQRKERKERRTVMDGSSAPKLTGSGRHGGLDARDMHSLNDPATISAVIFGLNLLHSSMKKLNLNEVDQKGLIAMMDPFVPMLTACICKCKDNDVALIAMKCLMAFLRFKLPSMDKCSKSLGTQALTFLSSSGSCLNQNNDMTQACFRTLTYLINRDRDELQADRRSFIGGAEGEEIFSGNNSLPLDGEQMRILIALLSVSVTESDQHNPALGLIKAILSRKFMSPEFYDLMESMLKINVRSQKASLRQQSAGIFIRYLLDYPMSEERFEEHLKQILANIGYEHIEGRLSAIEMLTAVIEKLPDALLQHHAQLLFLPQVLQLVNDDAKECREAVSKCLSTLFRRCPNEVLKSFHSYTVRWCSGEGSMKIASLQVFGIFIESCEAFARQCASEWLGRLMTLLQAPSKDWEVTYFSLICVEKLAKMENSILQVNDELWPCVVERLIDAHPWIKLTSCRIVQNLFASEEPITLARFPGMLFDIVRNNCFQINVDEEEQNEELSTMVVKILTKALPLAKRRPELCFTDDSPHAGLRDPVAWLLRRLSGIAKPKGRQRRMTVYKCFAAFCNLHSALVLNADDAKQRKLYLELMLEPLHRSHLEAMNESENPAVLHKASSAIVEEEMTESSLARDVLQMIEEGSTSDDFLSAYAVVKTRARDKKEQRKIQTKAEAVQDPGAAAIRKTKKHGQERDRKKRRVEDRRIDRGAVKKRRSHF